MLAFQAFVTLLNQAIKKNLLGERSRGILPWVKYLLSKARVFNPFVM